MPSVFASYSQAGGSGATASLTGVPFRTDRRIWYAVHGGRPGRAGGGGPGERAQGLWPPLTRRPRRFAKRIARL
jgi:hypothetical protein